MKKLSFAFVLIVSWATGFAQSQFPGTDSLRNYNNRFINNNASQAFTNLRLHNLLDGIIDFLGPGTGTAGVDTLFAPNDTTVRYRKDGVFRQFTVRGAYDNRRKVDTMYKVNDTTIGFTINHVAKTLIFPSGSSRNLANASLTANGDYIHDWTNHWLFLNNTKAFEVNQNLQDPNLVNNTKVFRFYSDSTYNSTALLLGWGLKDQNNSSTDSLRFEINSSKDFTSISHWVDGQAKFAEIDLLAAPTFPSITMNAQGNSHSGFYQFGASTATIQPNDSVRIRAVAVTSAPKILGFRSIGFGNTGTVVSMDIPTITFPNALLASTSNTPRAAKDSDIVKTLNQYPLLLNPFRTTPVDTIYFFGDSYIVGVGAGTGRRWSTLFSYRMGCVEKNMGVGGTTLEKRVPIDYLASPNMVDNIVNIPQKTARIKMLVFAFGLNDVGQTAAAYNPTNYKTDYDIVINACIQKGWAPNEILIIPPYWIGYAGYQEYASITGNAAPTVQRHRDYVYATQETATKWGTSYFDLFNAQLRNDTTLIDAGDHIHATNDGNKFIEFAVSKYVGADENILVGTRTPESVSDPLAANFGGRYGTGPGAEHAKVLWYDDGTVANRFGVTISGGAVDYHGGGSNTIHRFRVNNGDPLFTISSQGAIIDQNLSSGPTSNTPKFLSLGGTLDNVIGDSVGLKVRVYDDGTFKAGLNMATDGSNLFYETQVPYNVSQDFRIGPSSRMRIVPNGNVLIGSTSDNGFKVQVTGGATIDSLSGGTTSGDSLRLMSTSHATKGKVLFGNSAFVESSDFLGIGTKSPATNIDIRRNSNTGEGIEITNTNSGTGAGSRLLLWNETRSQVAQIVLGNSTNTFSPNGLIINASGGKVSLASLADDITFGKSTLINGSSEHARFKLNGNFLIGSTTDNSIGKLQLQGKITIATIDSSSSAANMTWQDPSTGEIKKTAAPPAISTGTSAPSSTPAKLGDMYIDTSNKKLYIATGTSSSADWTILN